MRTRRTHVGFAYAVVAALIIGAAAGSSSAHGQQWESATTLAAGGGVNNPYKTRVVTACDVTTAADGTILATWYASQPASRPYAQLGTGYVAALRPGSTKWSSPRVLWRHRHGIHGSTVSDGTAAECPELVGAGNGGVDAIWHEEDREAVDPKRSIRSRLLRVRMVSRRRDAAGRWAAARRVPSQSTGWGYPEALANAKGQALVAVDGPFYWGTYATRSPSGQWSKARLLVNRPKKGGLAVPFQMAIGNDGMGLLSFADRKNVLKVHTIETEGTPSGPQVLAHGPCGRGSAPVIAAGPQGRAVAASSCGGSVAVTWVRGSDGRWGAPQELEPDADDRVNVHVVGTDFDASGAAVLVWLRTRFREDFSATDVELREARLAPGAAVWSPPVTAAASTLAGTTWVNGSYGLQLDELGAGVAVVTEQLATSGDQIVAFTRSGDGQWSSPARLSSTDEKLASFDWVDVSKVAFGRGRGVVLWSTYDPSRVRVATVSLAP
jgi:hypothetical protein